MEYVYEPLIGLWTKCERVSADRFLKNWQESKRAQAFLLYDKQPFLPKGGIIFIHSAGELHSWARFIKSEKLLGYKKRSTQVRMKEKERIWNRWRANQIYKPTKQGFDEFWEEQDGVRSLFIMKNIKKIRKRIRWKDYSKLLEIGFPRGVGYRYLSKNEVEQLFKIIEVKVPSLPAP